MLAPTFFSPECGTLPRLTNHLEHCPHPPSPDLADIPPKLQYIDTSIFTNLDRGTISGSQNFPKFSQLPAEIRLEIWKLALPESTTVKREWNNSKFRFSLRRAVPAVLQACVESRLAFTAVKGLHSRSSPKYELVNPHGGSKDPGVYIDWKKDSLWIHRGFCIGATEMAAYSCLRSLTMDWGLRPCWVEGCVDEGIRFIKQFSKLEILALIVKFNEHGWSENESMKSIGRAKKKELQRIGAYIKQSCLKEQKRDPDWKFPQLRVLAS